MPPLPRTHLLKHVRKWAAFYADLADTMSRSHSGADRTDSVRNQLTAAALRRVLTGGTVAAAVEWFRREWGEFAAARNADVTAAPRMRHGPMAGCSSIHYKWACPSSGEQGVLNILTACRGLP